MLDEWDGNFWRKPSSARTIRFGNYQVWWDKLRDADNHYELLHLSQTQLEQNEYPETESGYPDVLSEISEFVIILI